jgi:hypothetical protein
MSTGAQHREHLAAALALEAEAQRLLLAGERSPAAASFRDAAEQYKASWELAPPGSYGRLVGMLKAAVLGEAGDSEAAYASAQLAAAPADSPTAAYGRAICALIDGDDSAASRWAGVMQGGSDAFERAGGAIAAIAAHDDDHYAAAIAQIVADFEARTEHLTGVAIADTALMLTRLGTLRGLHAELASAVLPS